MTPEQAVQQTIREYVAACNAGDVEAYKATLASDVVFCPPSQPKVRGREAVGAWAREGFFDPFEITLDFETDRIDLVESEVFVLGGFTLNLKPRSGGDPTALTGTFFNIFRQDDSTNWKYAWAIFNFEQPFG